MLPLLLVLACGAGGGGEPAWTGLPSYLAGGVAFYGDSRSGHDAHERMVEGIQQIKPAAVFHTGDLVNDGRSSSDWGTFNKITADLTFTTPFYPAIGNHENADNPATLYFEQFILPGNERWYTKDVNSMHFVVLDTDSSLAPASSQYIWLEAELQSVSVDSTVVVIFHYPPYSTGQHSVDTKGLRGSIVPLFETYDVDIVFTGHDHNYERSSVNGIYYIVSGGGGAPLRNQSRTSPESQLFVKSHHFCVIYHDRGKLMVDVWNRDVELVDQFVVSVP